MESLKMYPKVTKGLPRIGRSSHLDKLIITNTAYCILRSVNKQLTRGIVS